jgi:hypothetical protein
LSLQTQPEIASQRQEPQRWQQLEMCQSLGGAQPLQAPDQHMQPEAASQRQEPQGGQLLETCQSPGAAPLAQRPEKCLPLSQAALSLPTSSQ